ncbi:serine hydrolase domain-containing protein [Antrihabitans cavernicola]|uniref:Beta-lactamase family protein n=1 Tax=Antrihabitans cavernicola TaxID=2495913 RepID=A0A5A7SA26_9NOCA|nr:serine hydrolase domain-containing protein [Spelaeibacter cavernicola]KAA0023028.1 beta-lactamase family protein [Spelaeibacter cavernicola]
MPSLDQISQWPVTNAAAVVVTETGVAETYGDTDRVFPLASVTKLLVAYGVLVAIEEGAVELDQPAGPTGSTVRHLLAHASGLAFDRHTVQADPGKKRIYSSAGFEVLAEFVGDQATIAFPDYLAEAVFEPLGMASSELSGPAGHGAQSSAGDLARFAAELANPTLISPETHAAATTVQFPGLDGILPGYGTQRPNDWGLGFELRDHKSPHWSGTQNSARTFGHFGQSGTFLWADPDNRAACVVLTDEDFGDWAKPLWPALSDNVLKNLTS